LCRRREAKGEAFELEAHAAAAVGKAARAARLAGAAAELRHLLSCPPGISPLRHDEDLEAARSSIGEQAWAGEFERGRAMTLEQAVDYALERYEVDPEPEHGPAPAPAAPASATAAP
jgi:hypothetical protein